MELGFFERDYLIEKLAKEFYAIQGYIVSDDYRMLSSNHPQEQACVLMAIKAIEILENHMSENDE